MTDFIKTSASRSLENAVQEHFIPAEAPWSGIVRKGQTIRIEDSYGQQAIDTLFYRADDFAERYSNQDTMRAQGGAYIGTGTKIISNEGKTIISEGLDANYTDIINYAAFALILVDEKNFNKNS